VKKVNLMKNLPKTSAPRTKMLLVTAVTAIALPIFASASVSNISVTYEKAELNSLLGQRNVYQRLQDASRKLCGSSNVRETGSLMRSVANEECYEGTLTAAVERLDKDVITALHTN
jgi:UrcA family protein